MIRIRLSRSGVRKSPFYRIVAIDEKKQKKARFLDLIGYYFPKKGTVKIDKKLLEKWVKLGAKTTKAVEKILKS